MNLKNLVSDIIKNIVFRTVEDNICSNIKNNVYVICYHMVWSNVNCNVDIPLYRNQRIVKHNIRTILKNHSISFKAKSNVLKALK